MNIFYENFQTLEIAIGALRVIPAETRLTVYRRCPVLYNSTFFCDRKMKIEVQRTEQKPELFVITKLFDAKFLMILLIKSNFQLVNYQKGDRIHLEI